jgi:hypothetical protein
MDQSADNVVPATLSIGDRERFQDKHSDPERNPYAPRVEGVLYCRQVTMKGSLSDRIMPWRHDEKPFQP